MLLALLALSTSVLSQTLLWSDEFDSFDLSKWEHEITAGGGGNWEFEYYTNNRTNSYTRGGILYLKPTLTADTIGYNELANGGSLELWGGDPANLCTSNQWYGCERTAGGGGNVLNPIQSARIRSVSSFNFKYGRIEIRAKLPRGDWIWPALWMLPQRNAYGDWPASGEIDIVESRGNDASYSAGGCNVFGSTLHWGPYWAQDAYLKTHQTYTLSGGDFSTDFHVFGASWDATGYYTYLDSQSNVILSVNFTQMDFWSRGGWDTMFANPWVGATNAAPFDQEFFILFNLAVGGTNGYFPDGVGGKPWKDADPNAVNAFWNARGDWYPTWQGENAALQVDYVRVYSS